MEELLRRGQNFEFFVEGGRTRSGKPICPKGGLLSVLTDSIELDVVRDILIVPVGISYDKIVDGSFAK
jgi:glycerol-3-phosphate O-acyltransferase